MIQSNNNQLFILIINVNQINDRLNAIEFSINLDNFYPTKIKGLGHNGYPSSAATGTSENEHYHSNEDNNNHPSTLTAFGYANGTDITSNIIRQYQTQKKQSQTEKSFTTKTTYGQQT